MFQTFFADRMGLYVSVSYAPPFASVTLGRIIGAFVLVVPGIHHLGMFLAVTVVCEEGAAGKSAWLLWLGWHWTVLLGA